MSREPVAAGPAPTASPGQYLTFIVGECSYGLEILRVQEIKGQSTITPIPGSPPHVLGVMNLRGTVIPIVDLRVRFGVPGAGGTSVPVIIVVTLGTRVVGVVADGVSDVLDIPREQLVPAPDLGRGTDTGFLTGMARSEERLIALLSIDRIVGLDDLDVALAA
jgi:purine-binding chemotaxis protein CheW